MSDGMPDIPEGFEWRADVFKSSVSVALYGSSDGGATPIGRHAKDFPYYGWDESWLERAIKECAHSIWANIGRSIRVGRKLGVDVLIH